MMRSRNRQATIAACLATTVAMGSIHAFGVMLETMEAAFGGNRAGASLVYSLGLVSVTAAVLAGDGIFRRLSATPVLILAGVLAVTGTLLASLATPATLPPC